MKIITAIIQPFKIDEVRSALNEIGIQGLTVTDVLGHGRQSGHTEIYRGAEYEQKFVPKAKIELIITDDLVDKAIETISENAKTGKIGDGKIFVQSVEQITRVRTGETGDEAI